MGMLRIEDAERLQVMSLCRVLLLCSKGLALGISRRLYVVLLPNSVARTERAQEQADQRFGSGHLGVQKIRFARERCDCEGQ